MAALEHKIEASEDQQTCGEAKKRLVRVNCRLFYAILYIGSRTGDSRTITTFCASNRREI